ncbi:MAG: hypothetical protein K2K74_11180 [Lachnospiraceae bacterium]|nr:hypothetical protein [Lachnospiraceae bacterium]
MSFYTKYRLYDEGIEIMIPSDIEPAESFVPSQNSWLSKDKKTMINVTRGGADLTEENLNNRLKEYREGFCKDVSHFDCKKVGRRCINSKSFGEIQYLSRVTGYCFYNIFMLGSYRGRELIVTIQCMESNWTEKEPMLKYVADSIRVLKTQGAALTE